MTLKTTEVQELADRIATTPDDAPAPVTTAELRRLIQALFEARLVAGFAVPRAEDVDTIDAW